MQSLLRWSIENSTDASATTARRTDLDPGIIDAILGKPDAEQMKEDLALALDEGKTEEERVDALDHLEMLIEQIDNANDLRKLKMWQPLHSLLTDTEPSLPIKVQALWVIGTALQNNPSAQDAYLTHNPLPTLLSFLTPSPTSTLQTRSKAIYALSGLLKHNVPAVRELGSPEVDGWARLRDSLQDPDVTVRRKTLFLLNTLLAPTTPSPSNTSSTTNIHAPTGQQAPVHPNSHAAHLHDPSRASTSRLTLDAFKTHGLTRAVVSALVDPVPCGEDGEDEGGDEEVEANGARLLHTYVAECAEQLGKEEKERLRVWFGEGRERVGSEKGLAERLGMSAGELRDLVERLA